MRSSWLSKLRGSRGGAALSALTGVAALGVSGCRQHGAQEIYSVPRVACSGKPFVLKWSAQGKGVISAWPMPPEWSDLVVEDSGERLLSIGERTTFTLTVPDADPRERSKSAEVAVVTEVLDRSAVMTCDEQKKVHFLLALADMPGAARVSKFHDPFATVDGTRAPAEVCVSHLGQTRCVEPGKTVELDEPVQGAWELSLPQGVAVDCADAPGKLGIQLDFECR
jgi:hypothetical protein